MIRRLLLVSGLALSVGSTALAGDSHKDRGHGQQGGGGGGGGRGGGAGGGASPVNLRSAPEPSTLAALGLGAAGVAFAVWRGRRGK